MTRASKLPKPPRDLAPVLPRRRIRMAVVTAGLLAACAIAPPLALADDTNPCGAEEQVAWWDGPVQLCPLYSPSPSGLVPVYRAPVGYSQTPVPPPDGGLHGTSGRRFVCQEPHPEAQVTTTFARSTWWAYTLSDEGVRGWVSEVFFQGNADDEPDGRLRRCPEQAAAPTVPAVPPGSPPPPAVAPTPATGTPADSDHYGTPDSDDKCPGEDARTLDANLNGCLDLLRLRPAIKVTPGRFMKLAGGRYKALGIATHRVTVGELPSGARVSLSCTRGGCPFQRLTAKAGRRMEFKRMRDVKLKTGVRMTLRATFPGRVGGGTTYTILPNDMTKREFCIRPTGREGSCSTKR